MKKTFIILTISLNILTCTQSCKKDKIENPNTKTIYATIKSNETYQYNLGYFGVEEGASISRQPIHFLESKIERNSSEIIYTYIPTLNYVGKEEIELTSIRGSDGASIGNNIIITSIKLTITQ
jgi:hypothetical protein